MKLYCSDAKGFTLLEVLITVTISTMVIGLVSTVLLTSFRQNEVTQSHIYLRQEANLIVTKLRSLHQGTENYCLYYDKDSEMIFLDEEKKQALSLEGISIKGIEENGIIFVNNQTLLHSGKSSLFVSCDEKEDDSFEPDHPLIVTLKIADRDGNEFDIDTVIDKGKSYSRKPIEEEPDPEPEEPEVPDDSPFLDYAYIKNENIFVYGAGFTFSGSETIGPNATMVVKNDLHTNQLNGGAMGKVSNIFIEGNINLDGGSAGLGSSEVPGRIDIDGDLVLWGGTRDIYGDVYVNGDFHLKDAHIHGNVYVNGDLELGWTPTLMGDARIYYTGTLSHPDNYSLLILSKVERVGSVPQLRRIQNDIPQLRPYEWYEEHGYNQEIKPTNMRVIGSDIRVESYYDRNLERHIDTFTNAIIVSEGNIDIYGGDLKMTGVLFAPNGKVTFHGQSFDGLVIARDGFHVTSGGTRVTFRNIEEFMVEEEFPLTER